MSLPPNSWTEDMIENPIPPETNLVEWENPEWSSPIGFCNYPAAGALNTQKIFCQSTSYWGTGGTPWICLVGWDHWGFKFSPLAIDSRRQFLRNHAGSGFFQTNRQLH